jgi:hypothetical protein
VVNVKFSDGICDRIKLLYELVEDEPGRMLPDFGSPFHEKFSQN